MFDLMHTHCTTVSGLAALLPKYVNTYSGFFSKVGRVACSQPVDGRHILRQC